MLVVTLNEGQRSETAPELLWSQQLPPTRNGSVEGVLHRLSIGNTRSGFSEPPYCSCALKGPFRNKKKCIVKKSARRLGRQLSGTRRSRPFEVPR
jgi:hypothetical protein